MLSQMSTLPFEEKRNRVLLALYELHTTTGPHVKIEELQKLANVERRDFYDILRHIGAPSKGWLKKSNMIVRITAEGIDEAEDLLKMQLVEKERLVLRKIYDLGGPTYMDLVLIETLRKELGMGFRELNGILLDFERKKGWVEGPDEAGQLTPAGVREVENPGGESRGGGTTIHNIFHAPVQGGFIQGGSGHVQYNTFTNNPKLDETITALTRLIQESGIHDSDKEDILKDIERVKELAAKEKTPDSLQRINRRIDMIKTGIVAADTAEKGGKLLLKATPYLVTLWQLLTS
jgi:hypothetical protein